MPAIRDSGPLSRERIFILALLVALAAIGWVLVVRQAGDDGGSGAMAMGTDEGGGVDLTMGMGAPLFMATWVSMMVAMMFPTAAPMILTFARVSEGRRQRGQQFVPAWVFVAAYVAVWTLFGVAAYGAAAGLERAADNSQWLMGNGPRIGGAVLLVAGLYQLSPLKRTCLTQCQTPLQFVMTRWKEGHAGALRMGLEHGAYCLGCCWLLFVILFPLGVMNVAAMGAITALIFAEKALPVARQVSIVGALGLAAYGVTVLFVPDALPSMV